MRRDPRILAALVLVLLVSVAGGMAATPPARGLHPGLDATHGGGLLPDGSQPRAMAAADFDEDGMADVAVAFSDGRRGVIALLIGNRDVVDASEPEARRRRAKNGLEPRALPPFRVEGPLVDLPAPADLAGAGDFDNDGHLDLVVAAEGGRTLLLLRGDGRGGFADPLPRSLPGRLSRMVVGEMNHPDSLADIVVAVERQHQTEILVYEDPEGAWKAEPESVRRGGPITMLALGDLNGDFERDLLVGIDRGIEILHGRDRKLALGLGWRATVAAPALERHPLDCTPRRAAVGRFGGTTGPNLAFLADDGTVRLAAAGTLASSRIVARGRGGRLLVGARLGDGVGDDLVTIQEDGSRLRALAGLDVPLEFEPLDALSMRLGPEAVESLVVLNGSGPDLLSILPPAAPTTYTVTTIANSGPGSLRDAILSANTNAGADTIDFNISPSANLTIVPATPLPEVTDPVTIDATTQPGYPGTPIVEIDGSGPLPPGTNGLVVRAGQSVVRGLVIHGFSGSGVLLDGAGHNIVEGNFIGVDAAGTTAIGNQDSGVVIRDSHLNTIGGTAAPARNVLSGNAQAGVAIRGPSTFEAE
ncbi:MAG TPA: FG-GAP-like repeat-containing protein, partial [Candidatus Polarisedimenticolia bacterium]|nr:FG-GAP-like repeat-containing protein [Candidatus Polarisedimenticolia bacterium]